MSSTIIDTISVGFQGRSSFSGRRFTPARHIVDVIGNDDLADHGLSLSERKTHLSSTASGVTLSAWD